MSVISAWRLPLRLARRDALRHRGRSVLTLVMIALPVLAVTTADVLATTQSVSSTEGLDRRLGSAQALVTVQDGVSALDQGVDPDTTATNQQDSAGSPPATASQVEAKLGGARLLEARQGQTDVTTQAGQTSIETLEVDLHNALSAGLVRLVSGRLPSTADEVVVNRALVDDGYRVGQRLDVVRTDAAATSTEGPRIVGIAESTTQRAFPFAAGPVGSLSGGLDASAVGHDSWLVGGAPVSWREVRGLNAIGATVLSRQVVEHPPPASEIPRTVSTGGGRSSEDIQVLALVVIMVLIEVVLLAGPAFAVGARKQQRSLALLSASGGTPAQSRRVVLGSAVVLGGAASVVGLVLGLGLARAFEPLLQAHSDTYFGPFDIRWLHLVGVAAFGLLSAFLAAGVPAYLASRQDVVAVLAGRRGDQAPSYRSPLLGLVLLGVGIAGSVAGARGGGELGIAASAIPAVLGMVLLIPLVLAGLGRLSGRLPLVLRYAVRDAARHRTRTVPAVAAVAATVAGVVALSIGLSSDQKEQQETYVATLPAGVGIITAYGETPDWSALEAVVARDAPQATITALTGLPDNLGSAYVDTQVKIAGQPGSIASGSSGLGATAMVSDGPLPVGLTVLARDQAGLVSQSLTNGSSVVFVGQGLPDVGEKAKVVRVVFDDQGATSDRRAAEVPITAIEVGNDWRGPGVILTTAAAKQLGTTPTTVALALSGPTITRAQQSDLEQGLAAVTDTTSAYVERGYQPDQTAVILQWILIGMGAALMLGGTLTATFLALSDARPDLATLAAVGAAPRTRRGVAFAYTLVLGLVGAVLGTLVGLVPGLAVTVPLTSQSSSSCAGVNGVYTTCEDIGPFIDIPWQPLLVLIVALPLLVASVVALVTRSRLPLMARLD